MDGSTGEVKANRLCLLGRPRLLAAGTELPLPEKSYFLLAMLALSSEPLVDRETIRCQLWQSELPEKRAGSLRQLLSRIEQSIPEGLPPLLIATRIHLGLAPGWEIDLNVLKQKDMLEPDQSGILLGELLESVKSPTQGAEDWLTFERQRVDEARSAHLARILENQGE